MKTIDRMSARERQHLTEELEIEHRVQVVEAAKLSRQMKQLAAQLEAKQDRIQEIETGIALLR